MEDVFIDIHTHRWPPEGPWSVCCVPPARLAEVLAARGGGVGGHPRFSSGVHPWQAADAGADGDLALLEQWADDPRVAAIGECGLDKYAPAPLARQLEVLERQAWLAERVGKPLVVHCVGRVAELVALRRSIRPAQAWVVHGFRGKPQLAGELLEIYRGAREARMTRGELEELTEALIRQAPDRVLAAGLNKLALDHCSFDPVREIDYPARRAELFAFAAKQLTRCGGDIGRYRELLAELPGAVEFMTGDIYGDLPDHERVTGFRELYPAGLLQRYNIALVQGLLVYAESIAATAADSEPAELRRLFKYLKFFRLLAEVKRLPRPRGGKSAVSLSISGPYSLFANTRKYALQLAAFFPALVNLEEWSIRVKVKMGTKRGELKLDQSAGLVSHYRNFSSYVPEEIRMFHALFRKEVTSWKIVGESPFIDGGNQELVFPDLSFRRVADGLELHLELFHRWHRGQLERRLELLDRRPELPLLLGIDRALADDDGFAALCGKHPALAGRLYRFRDFPGVDRTVKMLDSFAEKIAPGAR